MPTGTFTNHPRLRIALPPLVKQQRRLAGQIATVAKAVVEEKQVRGEIDQLLVAAGFEKGQVTTCNGYDVRHHERDGQTSLNPDILTEQLATAGIDRGVIATILEAASETGQPSAFCTITPTKGAKVRP